MKEGWKYVKLGDIATIIHGKNQKEVACENGTYPIYGSGGTIMGYASQYLCEEGSTILGRKGTIDKPLYINHKFWNVDTAFGIVANKGVNKRFIYYTILSKDWKSKNSGTTLPSLTQSIVKETECYLPPLAEQGEIVAYLDKEFALVDALREKAGTQLQAAKDLFQATLKQLLTPKDGWTISTIEESTTIKSGKRVPKGYKLEDCDTGHKYIRVADFDNFGSVDTSEIKYINETIFNQIKRYIITSQDVYISIAGTIGKTGIIPKELDGANLTENANRFILNKGINQRFFYYYTRSEIFQKEIKLSTTTSAQPKLAIMRLKKVSFAYPPLPEQESIVAQLDSLSEKCRKLEDNYRQTLTLCNDLKQALLKQVFE